MKTSSAPIHIVNGEGVLLFDDRGNSYIDAISSWWTNLHGHAHPYIAEKVYEQHKKLEHVIFAGFTHDPALQLAERLVENHLPKNIHKIFYSDNGSTSVEVAIKMAIQYWQNIGYPKKKIIAFENAYHGDTFGSMSVSDRGPFTRPFHDYLFEVEFIPPPFAGNEELSLSRIENIISKNNVAAFIYEPLVMGAGGMLMYAPEALDNLLKIAKKNNVLCIADEVMTGFYRTGKMFSGNYCLLQPDIMCLSKGLTGGTMALGITACAEFIYNAFLDDNKIKTFYHGHSFTANPLACTSALASLDLLEKEGMQENINRIIVSHQKFAEQLKSIKHFENVRQKGTILALDIKTDFSTDYFNSIRDSIYDYFILEGILLRPLGNTLYLMPPYCITNEQLEFIYSKMLNLKNA